MNFGMHVSFQMSVFVFPRSLPGLGLLGHMLVIPPPVFWGRLTLCPTVAVPIRTCTSSIRGFSFSASSPTLVTCVLFDDGHSDRCEVVSHWGFDLYFLDDLLCWASFHVPVGHLLLNECFEDKWADFEMHHLIISSSDILTIYYRSVNWIQNIYCGV